jgi:CMP-N-acetylneuraminic acid synthetase
LRDAEHIRSAITTFQLRRLNYQISCFRFSWMNPWWAAKLDQNMVPTQLFPDAIGMRSQDLDHLYCPTGAIWIANRDALLEAGTFYGPDHRYWPMDWQGAVDIDDMNDFNMALVLARMRREKE